MRGGHPLSAGTVLRLTVAILVIIVNGLGTTGYRVLPWVLLVVALDLITGFLLTDVHVLFRDPRMLHTVLPTLAGAVFAAVALVIGPSALPLVVIPIFRAAECWGRRVGLSAGLVWLVSAVGIVLLGPGSVVFREPLRTTLWGVLALSLGLLAAWASRLAPPQPLTNPLADEAALLVSRLDDLASDLQGGLDPATSAEMLLDSLGRPGPMGRSAVLVGSSTDHPIPLALRGSERVPWPDPTVDEGVVGRAWRTGRGGVHWDPATHREVSVVPLLSSHGNQIGVLVQDVMATMRSADHETIESLRDAAHHFGPVIGVALAFANLRERAGFEERERLAREMHDGIAQELVALGFHLDRINRTAVTDPESCVSEIDAARTQLRSILGDLRSHITDLRVSVRPERGLGATMSSRLQSFGTSTGVVVSMRLDESGFRLPARVETALYQLFLDVLADIKHSGATGVDVDLTVRSPQASLRIRHDGTSVLTAAAMEDHSLVRLGGRVNVSSTDGLDLSADVLTPVSYSSPVHVQQKVPQAS